MWINAEKTSVADSVDCREIRSDEVQVKGLKQGKKGQPRCLARLRHVNLAALSGILPLAKLG